MLGHCSSTHWRTGRWRLACRLLGVVYKNKGRFGGCARHHLPGEMVVGSEHCDEMALTTFRYGRLCIPPFALLGKRRDWLTKRCERSFLLYLACHETLLTPLSIARGISDSRIRKLRQLTRQTRFCAPFVRTPSAPPPNYTSTPTTTFHHEPAYSTSRKSPSDECLTERTSSSELR